MERQTLEDTSIAAFLSVKGFKVTPCKTDTGKVIFTAEGENLNKALHALYENEKIGALDFIKSMKILRTSIFTLKGEGR